MTSANHAPSSELLHVLAALQPVLDPELGISIVDLGLIGDVRREVCTLVVEMLTTTPACPMRETLHQGACAALERAFPGDLVEVRPSALVWAAERMSAAARRALGWD